jgi:23S rRNA (guanine745-N1)-methyltransferase
MHQADSSSPCYLCPLCSASLQLKQKSYVCENNHSFDLAKEGYVNLLPVQHKHSAQPGDNKQMMQARREFLEAGYYEPMAKALARMINQKQPRHLLDLGCGEGYYSRQIEAFCSSKIMLHGIDIAKYAVAAAAKKQPNARYVVASSKRLPYADHYFDMVFRVFAPSDDEEIKRILKPSGFLLTVTPGPRHLWQLKQFIYAEVREHPIENPLPQGFERIETERISYKIAPNPRQRIALLQMTPFAWRANDRIRQTIQDIAELDIETDFILTLAANKTL